uniref:Small ribosomal subunit protein uS3c n=2 Tax=Chrysochromulina TaxID=35140 RepID=A0A075DW74_9EUKA|nr:30S ribosomal protein S3 [Chrysochromulina parva]AHY04329.1 30S ribosomal protein S3 [Chrysochromulina tobinii]AUS84356.1 30S ribosomal protein S3 [Chrysochromulina parva]
MGQKTHPTGFRIGVNKTHSSTWFANYGVYGNVLKEDYKIREFFEKKFESIYSKAGITKLEIQRKINQLELIIHAARPKAIALDTDKDNFITSLKDSIKALLKEPKQVRIKVLQVAKSENESSLVARSIGDQLEKRVAFKKAVRQTTQMLQKSGAKGFKIQVSGRLNGAEIARAEWAREGRVPLQTLRADISYATHRANTIYGVLGIKVWIFNKEIL